MSKKTTTSSKPAKLVRITGKNGFSLVRNLSNYQYQVINDRTGRLAGWGVNYSDALMTLTDLAGV